MNIRIAHLSLVGPAVAVIALVAALAGSAVALPGSNTVDANDIRRNAVKSKQIKNGSVTSADLANGTVSAIDLADPEPPRLVGTAGQPAFETGGDGDCIWNNANTDPAASFAAAVSFYKDPDGRVHLSGVATPVNGPGGDAACGGSDGTRDGAIFILPPGYRPAAVEFFGGADPAVAVVGVSDLTVVGVTLPAGAVLVNAVTGTPRALGGVSFRAAGEEALNLENGPIEATGSLLELLK